MSEIFINFLGKRERHEIFDRIIGRKKISGEF